MTVVPIDVADDFSSGKSQNVKSIQLWVELMHLGPGDVIDYRLNGHKLSADATAEPASIVKLNVQPDQLKAGRNEVGLRLDKRGLESEHQVIVAAVEIHVDYE